MNVMLTCAGRRSHSVEFFKQALGDQGRVFACDSSASAPALQKADKAFVVPAVDHEDYIDALLSICDDHQIGLLVPALEPELLPLAIQRARFLDIGTLPLVSTPEIVATCYDKLATSSFLSNCGLRIPHTFDSLDAARAALSRGEITFPVVVKPRWGVSSIAMQFPEDEEEIDLCYKLSKKQIERSFIAQISATDSQRSILIQERLLGEEYGMDVINDLSGSYICTFIRRKMRMWAGQTDQAVTVRDDRLELIGKLIGEKLGHFGILDCDVFVTEHGCYPIDINPRFGGGYPFSHIAGANLPAALIAWANGQQPDPAWFCIEPNVSTSRYDCFVVTNRKPIETARPWERPNPLAGKNHALGESRVRNFPKTLGDISHNGDLSPRNDVSKETREPAILARMKRRSQPGKRYFDLALTLPALLLLSPLIVVAAVLAAIGVGSPILFRQQRPGLLGKPFILIKFRTMTDARDANGKLKPDAARTPPIGRFLRMSSLDELPQLWNIIRGEMSLVGPRPLLMEYLPHYTAGQSRRHSVLPGMTGWAQINGRNLTSFSQRLKLDVWYVDHWNLWLDFKILARTIISVLRSSGVKLEQPLEEVDDVGLHPETRKKIRRSEAPGVTDT